MIYTDIKQAIGSTLLDVKEYTYWAYCWDVYIFNTGITVRELEFVEGEGYRDSFITEINEQMPEELKELIKKYQ